MIERKKLIMKELNKLGTVYVTDLVEIISASDSTIRRDLVELDEQGLLKRIHGGATLLPKENNSKEDPLSERQNVNLLEKKRIAEYAACLIEKDDVVYLDAGSTTLEMIDYFTHKDAFYVTNGLMQAHHLSLKGFPVVCIGGEVRGMTGACVGGKAFQSLSKYHFTKGFFGTNGVDNEYGFTTVDSEEAIIKEEAMNRCSMRYVVCDHTKFQKVCPIHFADLDDALIITDQCSHSDIKKYATIVEVDKK